MKSLQVVLVAGYIFSLLQIGTCQCDVVRIAAAVHETLSPFMTDMRESLAAVKTEMRESLAAVKTEMRESLAAVKTEMKEDLSRIETKVDSLSGDIEEHKNKTAELSMTVTTVHSELEHNVLTNVTKELKKTADYIILGTGGWRRVVYLNMTDPNTNCPSGWRLTSHSKITCGRVSTSDLSCDSVFFPVSGGDYTSVCGSIRAYQVGVTDAFEAYHLGAVTTIEGPYVSGVSLTHGSPRQHIWTFAAGLSEAYPTRNDACPCDASINITIPPFVGADYFCESGVNSGFISGFHPDDPLWDGEGCGSSSSCCSFNSPPYFTKTLPSPTSDPIEVRLCRYSGLSDDTPVEFMELYVK
ncbi:hypothetical protein GBAR_LOCUS31621 [Geodia barretti]|uniref:Uncharacterized protein n=1 Tax=Geodia barretti TaxID=519541 RepID=A0AA35U3L8_GEOBA|nr:hypothetical protein GBAR_LOCUS31621 [Geodia barretti]